MTVGRWFFLIGLTIALLEEFITQGVLKRNLFGWIIPSFIAFFPFLAVANLIQRLLARKVSREDRRVLYYYLICGGVGLMLEWFLIGLAPRYLGLGTDPLLALAFQLAMFSFWGSVAFVPTIMLDERTLNVRLRRWLKRFLVLGFTTIYLVALLSGRALQFAAGIISVMVVFLSLNFFYAKYIQIVSSLQTGFSKS